MKIAKVLSLFLLTVLFTSCHSSQKKSEPVFNNPQTPPYECQTWYDGCNKCRAHKGTVVACTRMACFEQKTPKCLKYTTGPSSKEIKKTKCKKSGGTFQKNNQGQWVCMQETTDAKLPCDTSAECQSLCLYYPRQKRGFCSKFKPFIGCAEEYQNGKHFQVCQ